MGCIRPDEDVEVYLHRVTRFVWIINSWSVCDTFKFGGGKAFIRRNEARLWEYLKEWMKASGEYEVRFGVVMGMSYFLDEAHLEEYLSLLDGIRHEGYYVRMAVAWALSFCFVKFPELFFFRPVFADGAGINTAVARVEHHQALCARLFGFRFAVSVTGFKRALVFCLSLLCDAR